VGVANLEQNLDESHKKEYKRVMDSRYSFQKEKAVQLMKDVGVPLNRVGRIEDVPLYEDFLKISICVVSASLGTKRAYSGNIHYSQKLYLYHYETENGGHFDLVTKINALMGTSYFCEECWTGFNSRNQHCCKIWCNICGREDCVENPRQVKVKCADCNRYCRSNDCFKEHKHRVKITRGKEKGQMKDSMCDKFWQCSTCSILLRRSKRMPEKHECGENLCTVCHEYYIDSDHRCYMRSQAKECDNSKLIFYDFECHQDTQTHVPNFAIAQSVCQLCEDKPVTSESKCSECGSRCKTCNAYNKKEKTWEREPCTTCGYRQVEFNGKDTYKKFCKWLFDHTHANVTAIAHNSRAYDAYFIFRYCNENGIVPEVIFNGSKIMYLKVSKGVNIRLLDSLNFLPMPLAKFPKSFGLTELKKGFFPHFFNTEKNENVVLPTLPDIEYYGPDQMSEERRDEFFQWYEKNKESQFDFQKEIREYCISDVDILLKGCLEFRKLVKQATGNEISEFNPDTQSNVTRMENGIDPFSYLTIPSVCLGIFRAKFLPEKWKILTNSEAEKNPECMHEWNCKCEWIDGRKKDAFSEVEIQKNGEWVSVSKKLSVHTSKFVSSPIGLIPPSGYSGSDNHSKEALQWLHILEQHYRNSGNDISIQTARCTQGEKIILYKTKKGSVIKYKVDGYFIDRDGNRFVCEYYGCNWHGCLKCYPKCRDIPINGKSLDQKYSDTLLKEKRLKELGYKLVTKWSCDFHTDLSKPENKDMVSKLDIQSPIDVREGYTGGRVEGVMLHNTFPNGSKGHYVDFTSLYPDVLKYKRFPVGHPERIVKDFQDIVEEQCPEECDQTECNCVHYRYPYFGMSKVKVLPPQNLLFPILPMKINGKLKFALCRTCAEKETSGNCLCPSKDRCFTSTFCTPELEVAIQRGYKILKTYEVLNWEKTEMYDDDKKQGGIFSEYVNTFLKIKQESSNYPVYANNKKEREKYIVEYLEHEGVLLDSSNISTNPGLRSVAKLALNSLYGKFGQKTIMKKTKLTTESSDIFELYSNPAYKLCDWHIMSDNIIALEYKDSEHFECQSLNTNVVLSAFCTSWARLKLFSVLEKLGDRVLYYDTDSVIYTSCATDKFNPKLGNYLGELTNELTCKNVGCEVDSCIGHWITEFISCGPKNYTYKLNTGQVFCKVRGFTLNHQGSQVINFESMKNALYMYMKKEPTSLVTIKTQITRNKYKQDVYNRTIAKHYSIVYDKRQLMENFSTLPFGYNDNLVKK
jgi:hypothetical protein